MERILEGNVAIVTGGARGIGRAICLELAGKGADVVISDRDYEEALSTHKLVKSLGARSLIVTGDITEKDCRERLVSETLDHFGKIDTLVNNAALVHFGSDIVLNPSEEETRLVLETNFHAPRLLTCRVAEYMKGSGIQGSIINITSVHADLVRMQAHYSASKAALAKLTEEWAVQYGPFGIRVNAIAPGAIHPNSDASSQELQDGHFRYETPLGRMGLSSEVGKAAVFLASNDLSGFVTGETIRVDGGLYLFNWSVRSYLENLHSLNNTDGG